MKWFWAFSKELQLCSYLSDCSLVAEQHNKSEQTIQYDYVERYKTTLIMVGEDLFETASKSLENTTRIRAEILKPQRFVIAKLWTIKNGINIADTPAK